MRTRTLFLILIFVSGSDVEGLAQDLEPRAYSAAPIGTRFIVAGVARSTGDVLVDPGAPIQDIHAETNLATVGVGGTFSFFGRTGLALAAFPYAWSTVSGRVGETAAEVTRSGLADPRMKFSVNLIGGRALKRSEFGREKRPTIVGASITVAPPLGQYDPVKLVNLGANRWGFKPEAGISHAIGNWTVDGYAGVWMFTANNKYFTGSSVRSQDPIYAFQAHASYTFKPRLWLAFDTTWYTGGQTIVDGVEKGTLQRSTRLGATLSIPLMRQQSVKVAVSKGAATRAGADFTTVSAAWQISWLN